MKIAFYTREKHPPEVDYFSMEERLIRALKCRTYDLIVLEPTEKSGFGMVTLMGRYRPVPESKYTAHFNGQFCALEAGDIYFLESYCRKASVVTGRERIRIQARLDEEEKRLPRDQFVRINRHNIINMQYVRSVKGERVEMQNGELLYVNEKRKKAFEKQYRCYLKKNCMEL